MIPRTQTFSPSVFLIAVGKDLHDEGKLRSMTAAAALRLPRGPLRTGWGLISAALALYFVGTVIGQASWLRGVDPFPGSADIFYLAFYPPAFAAVLFLARARLMRMPWGRLALDGAIFVVGFGAFFWILVVRPASTASEVDVVKQALSQSYVALNCLLMLAFGVLLLTEAGSRRIPLALLAGFTTMFLGDILWALGKVGGGYLPGGLQDVMYVACSRVILRPIETASSGRMRRRSTASR